MFYIPYSIFWFILLPYVATFGEPMYDLAFQCGDTIQKLCLPLAAICLSFNFNRKRLACFMFMSIYSLYNWFANYFFGEIISINYMLEAVIFCTLASYIALHATIKSDKTLNPDNVWLAFYKGDKGSIIMRISELFGFPVRSMSTIAGSKALYLKRTKPTFVFGDSDVILRKSKDYIIKDTGVKYTPVFMKLMREHTKVSAKGSLFRVRCIDGVKGLLNVLGDDFKPKTSIPSLYLRNIA